MDSRISQTSAASPAKPGASLCRLVKPQSLSAMLRLQLRINTSRSDRLANKLARRLRTAFIFRL
jgi:hypothetical protein